ALAAPADHFQVTKNPTGNATAGDPFAITVTALDNADSVDTTYVGTVTFSGGGTGATLPADYTFTAGDAGEHMFSGVILTQAGLQTITVEDLSNSLINGQVAVTVDPAGPTQLAFGVQPTNTYAGEAIDGSPLSGGGNPITVELQ